jgi:CBS domain-containing protein
MHYVESFAKKVVTASPQDTLAAVARSMEAHNVGAVVITENHRPVGILTDRDVALELGARNASPETPAVRVMTTPAETILARDGVFAATRAMLERKVRRLAVVGSDGQLVGIVTVDDLLRLLGRELSNLVEGIAREMQVK